MNRGRDVASTKSSASDAGGGTRAPGAHETRSQVEASRVGMAARYFFQARHISVMWPPPPAPQS